MMSTVLLEPMGDKWADFISSRSDATIFHYPTWGTVISECYGYRPLLPSILDEDGEIEAGLPMMAIKNHLSGAQIVSLPFSDFCRPLVVSEDALNRLINALQQWRREVGSSEIQIHWPLEEAEGVYRGESAVAHVTTLNSDYEGLFKDFRKGVKSSIRQAEKGGVILKHGNSWDDVKEFYALHLETRRRLGTPVQPFRFFRLLWKRLIDKDLGFVVSAYKDSQLLASSIFLHWNGILTYKFSASRPEFWELRPNNLILWHAIRWGCENGYRIFDWGKTDIDNEGLRTFKRGWASEEKIMHYSILGDKPPKPSRIKMVRPLLTKFIQHSPPWVCRLIGELFYKYAA
jgi:CelD/BcsL family acetyltransferase involved in cellulose biosynthesis